jgi:hypothetical protein
MLTIYPSLPAKSDLGVLRIAGNGIGNCLYAYFHAVVLAKQHDGQLIAPTWRSLKVGPLLRREFSLRRYGKMFRPHPDEISGLNKAFQLAIGWRRRKRVQIRIGQPVNILATAGLMVVQTPIGKFTFAGLHSHREMLRRRLLEIMIHPPREAPRWGTCNYVAVHIRLGDFKPSQPDQIKALKDGLRIPLVWYEAAIRRVRAIFPELPVLVFSDGHEHELADILTINGVKLRREPSDVADLLALAQARLLIGSNSTFSRWAAFLGNMPSIWLKTEQMTERPTSEPVPFICIDDDFEAISRENLCIRDDIEVASYFPAQYCCCHDG